jgi:hypothetical protein
MVTRSMRRRGEVDTWPPFVINSQISSSGGEVSHSTFCAGYRQLLGRTAFCFLYRIRTVQGRTAFVIFGGLPDGCQLCCRVRKACDSATSCTSRHVRHAEPATPQNICLQLSRCTLVSTASCRPLPRMPGGLLLLNNSEITRFNLEPNNRTL